MTSPMSIIQNQRSSNQKSKSNMSTFKSKVVEFRKVNQVQEINKRWDEKYIQMNLTPDLNKSSEPITKSHEY